ncbi:MAG: hypothetical protein ACYDA5_09160 [Vulcanimicrobiaceae bacterium]
MKNRPFGVRSAVLLLSVAFALLLVAGGGRSRPAPGTIAEYPIPTASAQPYGITAGPDGNLWFTEYREYRGNKIGKITP